MIRIIALIKRRPGLSPAEFAEYYEHRHAPLFHRVIPPQVADAIVRYAQHHAVRLGSGGSEPAYDCVTELGFDDLGGMRTWSDWYLGDDGKVLRDDEEHFMDVDERVVIVVDEHDIGIVR